MATKKTTTKTKKKVTPFTWRAMSGANSETKRVTLVNDYLATSSNKALLRMKSDLLLMATEMVSSKKVATGWKATIGKFFAKLSAQRVSKAKAK